MFMTTSLLKDDYGIAAAGMPQRRQHDGCGKFATAH
jgi:hypothetical protein